MISNGKNTTLDRVNRKLPSLGSAIEGFLLPMTFGVVTKEVINFKSIETKENIKFLGAWQFKRVNTAFLSEHQRTWKFYSVHTKTDLKLKLDDTISYRGKFYRVESNAEYDEYGYFMYDLVDDYTGSGPERLGA